MDWPTAWVATAAAVGTSSVAIYSIRHQGKEAEKDRAHDRETRRQERRSAAYIELMTALERQMMQVDRTSPMLVIGVPPEPPPPFSDEELWRLNALTEVIASEELRDTILAWTRKQAKFNADVWYLSQIQEHEKTHSPGETAAAFAVDSMAQWQKVEEIRVELRSDLSAIGKIVRAEL